MRFEAVILDLRKGMDLFPSGDSKKHRYLVYGADHIVGADYFASFLVATYGAVADETPKLVLTSGLKGSVDVTSFFESDL